MGRIKYKHAIEELFEKSPVVSITSLKKLVREQKGNEKYVYLLVNNMLAKGEIKKLGRGFYTTHEDPVLAVFYFAPAYIGLQDALAMHNLWEQETIPVILTTKKIRQGIREILGNNILIRRISPKYFFGFEYVKQNSFCVPVSNIEKTFIDLTYFRQNIDKKIERNLKKKISKERLKRYLRKYPKNFRKKVLRKLI